MVFVPVARDIEAPADPDVVARAHVVEEARQRRDAPRPADQAAVQPHRHHARRGRALGVERVEGVAQVGEEPVAGIEALGGGTLRGPSSGLGRRPRLGKRIKGRPDPSPSYSGRGPDAVHR